MDQEAAIQAYLAKYKNPSKREILSTYIRTPKGRNRIAEAMLYPVKLALNYLDQTTKDWIDIDIISEGHVKEYNWFLTTVPEEEQEAEPFPELKSLVERLQVSIDRIKKRSPKSPTS